MCVLYHPLRHTGDKSMTFTSVDVSHSVCGPRIPSVSHCINMYQRPAAPSSRFLVASWYWTQQQDRTHGSQKWWCWLKNPWEGKAGRDLGSYWVLLKWGGDELWSGISWFFSCCHKAYLVILWLHLCSQCCCWHRSAFTGDFFLNCRESYFGCRWFPNL